MYVSSSPLTESDGRLFWQADDAGCSNAPDASAPRPAIVSLAVGRPASPGAVPPVGVDERVQRLEVAGHHHDMPRLVDRRVRHRQRRGAEAEGSRRLRVDGGAAVRCLGELAPCVVGDDGCEIEVLPEPQDAGTGPGIADRLLHVCRPEQVQKAPRPIPGLSLRLEGQVIEAERVGICLPRIGKDPALGCRRTGAGQLGRIVILLDQRPVGERGEGRRHRQRSHGLLKHRGFAALVAGFRTNR